MAWKPHTAQVRANTLLQRYVGGALLFHLIADLTAIAWAIHGDQVLLYAAALVARLPLIVFGYWSLRTLERRDYSGGDRRSAR